MAVSDMAESQANGSLLNLMMVVGKKRGLPEIGGRVFSETES